VSVVIDAPQLAQNFAVSVIDAPQFSQNLAMRDWRSQVVHIHDERFEKALGVNYVGMPGGCDQKQFTDGMSYPSLTKFADEASPTVIVAPITAQLKHPFMRAHYILDERCPLRERSMVLTEQIRTVDKRRLENYIGRLPGKDMLAIGRALRYSLGLCQ